LSVGAAYGLLVVVFKWGVGETVVGTYQFPQVEGWIPIFLFAMLFGLSMDYEVFLVSRMRETWDEDPDNGRAVAAGLERTGRIVTAAADEQHLRPRSATIRPEEPYNAQQLARRGETALSPRPATARYARAKKGANGGNMVSPVTSRTGCSGVRLVHGPPNGGGGPGA